MQAASRAIPDAPGLTKPRQLPDAFDNLWDDPAQHERRFALLGEHFDAMMATSGAGPERVAMY